MHLTLLRTACWWERGAGMRYGISGESAEADASAANFLLQSGSGLSILDLDKTVEEWLQNTYQADIDFEADDALSKLLRLGITTEENGCYRACPIDEALRLLDKKWDSYFTYNNEPPLEAD